MTNAQMDYPIDYLDPSCYGFCASLGKRTDNKKGI